VKKGERVHCQQKKRGEGTAALDLEEGGNPSFTRLLDGKEVETSSPKKGVIVGLKKRRRMT